MFQETPSPKPDTCKEQVFPLAVVLQMAGEALRLSMCYALIMGCITLLISFMSWRPTMKSVPIDSHCHSLVRHCSGCCQRYALQD